MLNHLDGPTLIVTKLPDGSFAWTVISPREMRIDFDGGSRLNLMVSGRVVTGDWQPGTPPADWDRQSAELPAGVGTLTMDHKRLTR